MYRMIATSVLGAAALSGCTLFQAANLSKDFDGKSAGLYSWDGSCSREDVSSLLSGIQNVGLDENLAGSGMESLPSFKLNQFSDFELGRLLLVDESENASLTLGMDSAARSALVSRAAFYLGLDLNELAQEMSPRATLGAGLPVTQSAALLVSGLKGTAVYEELGPHDEGASFRPTTGRGGKISLSTASWIQFNKQLNEVTVRNGWTSAAVEALGAAVKVGNSSGFHLDRASVAELEMLQDAREKALLFSYFKAYFRNGNIFKIDFDASGLKSKLEVVVKDAFSGSSQQADIDEASEGITNEIDSWISTLCNNSVKACYSFGVIGETTFVTKVGKSYGFPGITATLNPGADKKISTNKIARKDFITDLVRVFFEAVYDNTNSIPGVANSTLCQVRPGQCIAEGDAEKLVAIAHAGEVGDRVETATTSTVSLVVRGGWILSLNNETLADIIEVGAGVAGRKVAESAAYHSKMSAACEPSLVKSELQIQ